MLFSVSAPINGTVVMLADGHTARFTPAPGYTGVPSFTFTATDAGGDPNTVLAWDFDLPDSSTPNTVPDVSGNGRDGTIDFASTGTYSLSTMDKPSTLSEQGARSIDLVENTTTAARVQRTLATTELDWNNDNWTVAGWFKRRDTDQHTRCIGAVLHRADTRGQTLAGGAIGSSEDIAGAFQMNNLTLAGTSSAATTATISGGSFTLFNNGTQLPSVNLTGTSGTSPNILTYNINTPISLGADTTFNATNSGTFIFNGDISGAGRLTRASSSGKLVLAGTNTYTGDTIISAGTLQIGNDGATGSLGTGDVINNGTLRFDRTGTLDVPNAIGGTGGVQIDCPINAGTIVFSGAITLAGGGGDTKIFVNAGTLTLGGALDIIAGPGLTVGTTFTILNKSSAGAMSGTFAGKPNGSVFTASGRYWQINYAGGNGNDVALMLLSALDGWRYIHFGTFTNSGNAADLFDANGDGESNFMEYATGQNPHAATTARPGIVRNGATPRSATGPPLRSSGPTHWLREAGAPRV